MNSAALLAPLATIDVGGKMGILQDLSYQLVGMLIVMVALGTIAIVLFLLGGFFARHSAPVKKPAPAAPAAPASSNAPPPEICAVIAAAVHVALPGMSQIVEIRQDASSLSQVWSMEGRRQIFQSHRVR